MFDKPIVGITMGDPASIGPEIAVKALLNESIYSICKPLIVGDAEVFKHIINRLNLNASINVIKSVDEAKFNFGEIDVYDLKNVDIKMLAFV
jgi:4-hydroxy-L-threonine phosphate dehydrogenase PdxA